MLRRESSYRLAASAEQRHLDQLGQREACRVLIAYEDVVSRDSALRLCDRVFQEFQDDLDFEADWWAFKYLEAPELGEKAAGAAANSDLLIVSADGRGDFPLQIKHLFECWLLKLGKREQPEAALV